MAKEKKLEYERVDEKDDKYKRVLVKFNPRILRGPEFEIEFIPLGDAHDIGKVFVTEIDSMNSIDLYRWSTRHTCLEKGGGDWERGTIPFKGSNDVTAEYIMKRWRAGEVVVEPRQIISRVKRVFEGVAKGFSKATAFAYNYFLYSGQLGSLPYSNEYFTIKLLKYAIEEFTYHGRTAEGGIVERTLVEHLIDTHKTEYVVSDILNFLQVMFELSEEIMEEYEEKKEQ